MDILATATGWTISNMGQNGREIPSDAPAFPDNTDLLIVLLGTNDLLQGISPEQAAGRPRSSNSCCTEVQLRYKPGDNKELLEERIHEGVLSDFPEKNEGIPSNRRQPLLFLLSSIIIGLRAARLYRRCDDSI